MVMIQYNGTYQRITIWYCHLSMIFFSISIFFVKCKFKNNMDVQTVRIIMIHSTHDSIRFTILFEH